MKMDSPGHYNDCRKGARYQRKVSYAHIMRTDLKDECIYSSSGAKKQENQA